jgi:inorganic pyrophosphatase
MIVSYNINWNYGLLPQTWEDPSSANSEVEGAFGDNDPGISSHIIFHQPFFMFLHFLVPSSSPEQYPFF